MIVCKIFTQFIFYSFLGWMYETLYCTARTGHWSNRGFMHGPICPIYGFGVIGLQLVFFEGWLPVNNEAPWWQIFAISFVGSAIMEYITSFVLEKKFKARWWDYSNVPFNIKGRICLPASIGFGLAGIVISKLILPILYNAGSGIPSIIYEILALILMAISAADLALTVASLTALLETLDRMEEEFNEAAEARVIAVGETKQAVTESIAEKKQAVTDTIAETKQNVISTIDGTRDAITGSIENTKEAISGGIENTKEKIAESIESTRERFLGDTDENRRRMKFRVDHMNYRQRYLLRNIKHYSTSNKENAAEKLKKALAEFVNKK